MYINSSSKSLEQLQIHSHDLKFKIATASRQLSTKAGALTYQINQQKSQKQC